VDQTQPVGRILANEAEIEQVLLNLIINASHAVPAKGGRIEVGCQEERNEEGDEVVLFVKDNGTGIAPEVLAKLFEFGFTTKGDKGNGIGLSISKSIIEAHQGKIIVKSEPGKGAQFYLRLPRAK
jgi:signal transduction histidine kinase